MFLPPEGIISGDCVNYKVVHYFVMAKHPTSSLVRPPFRLMVWNDHFVMGHYGQFINEFAGGENQIFFQSHLIHTFRKLIDRKDQISCTTMSKILLHHRKILMLKLKKPWTITPS